MIDAHVHVWRLGDRPQPWIDPATMGVLDRDHEWSELVRELEGSRVRGAVLVQVINDPDETADYLRLSAEGAPGLLGVVGWTDLLAPDVGDTLDRLATQGRLVGVRHQAQAEPDPAAWLARAGDGPGLPALAARDLACDLMLRPAQLRTAREVAGRHEGVRFVLDHAGKPPISSGWSSPESQEWADLVSGLGRMSHVACKFSGLTTMADPERWSLADLAPYAAHLLDAFGAERLIFGSDWPVSRRGGDYARTTAAARDLVAHLSPDEQRAILAGNAVRTYRLDPAAGSRISPWGA